MTQTCIALWFIFFVPPVSHESMRMAWFLFGPKCRVWCLFGGAQSIKHKPPVKTQDLCKFSPAASRLLRPRGLRGFSGAPRLRGFRGFAPGCRGFAASSRLLRDFAASRLLARGPFTPALCFLYTALMKLREARLC